MSAPIATEPEAVQLEPVGSPDAVVGRSPRQLFWARFKQDKAAFVGLAVIIMLVLLAILARVIANIVGHGPERALRRGGAGRLRSSGGPDGRVLDGRGHGRARRLRAGHLRRPDLADRGARSHGDRSRDRDRPRPARRILRRRRRHGHLARNRHHPLGAGAPLRDRDRRGLLHLGRRAASAGS